MAIKIKIWLIRHYAIEQQEVIAVCTSLETARKIMGNLRGPSRGEDYVIEEWPIDEADEGVEVDARRGKPLFDWT